MQRANAPGAAVTATGRPAPCPPPYSPLRLPRPLSLPLPPLARLAIGVAALTLGLPQALADGPDPTPNAFVAVELPAPASWSSGIGSGTVLGVNNDGWARGWVDADGGTDDPLPFIFDPSVDDGAPRGTLTLLPISTYSTGVANAVVEDGGIFPAVVGTVVDSSGHSEAVYWTWDDVNEVWDLTHVFNAGSDPSEGHGITRSGSELYLTGVRKSLNQGADWQSFQFIVSTATEHWYTTDPSWSVDVIVPTGATDPVSVGRRMPTSDLRAFHWDSSGNDGLHPSAYAESAATAINERMDGATARRDIVGWARASTGIYSAAIWCEGGMPPVLVFQPITGMTHNAFATDINDSREVVGNLGDPFGSVSESFIWTHDDSTPVGDLLSEITRFPTYDVDNLITEANAINNNGWIGGALQPDGATEATPCLVIPYDVDNNGVPDYREIGRGHRDDDGLTSGIANNWIPDDFEGMRVGLYPGSLSLAQRQYQNAVPLIYSVRMHLNLAQVHGIVEQESIYWDFTDAVCDFRSGDDGDVNTTDTGKEIIVMIRSSGVNSQFGFDADWDFLPPIPLGNSSELNESETLDSLARFAHANARCIDYIEIGNEWLTGPGQYYLREADYSGATCDASLLSRMQSGTCQTAGLAAVLEWWHKQYETAQAASALAGRPLRFISASVHSGTINQGSGGNPQGGRTTGDPDWDDNQVAFAMVEYLDFVNERGIAMAFHSHYTREGYDAMLTAMTALYTDPDWEAPELITCTEWSPLPRDEWWRDNKELVQKFFKDTPCDPQAPDVTMWHELLGLWKIDPDPGFEGDLMMDEVLDEFAARGFLHACYGEFGHGEIPDGEATFCLPTGVHTVDEPDRYNFVVLRANQVKSAHINQTFPFVIKHHQSTVINDDLEAAAGHYDLLLQSWSPPRHPTADCGCGGE